MAIGTRLQAQVAAVTALHCGAALALEAHVEVGQNRNSSARMRHTSGPENPEIRGRVPAAAGRARHAQPATMGGSLIATLRPHQVETRQESETRCGAARLSRAELRWPSTRIVGRPCYPPGLGIRCTGPGRFLGDQSDKRDATARDAGISVAPRAVSRWSGQTSAEDTAAGKMPSSWPWKRTLNRPVPRSQGSV